MLLTSSNYYLWPWVTPILHAQHCGRSSKSRSSNEQEAVKEVDEGDKTKAEDLAQSSHDSQEKKQEQEQEAGGEVEKKKTWHRALLTCQKQEKRETVE